MKKISINLSFVLAWVFCRIETIKELQKVNKQYIRLACMISIGKLNGGFLQCVELETTETAQFI